jgi:hypothetical protein
MDSSQTLEGPVILVAAGDLPLFGFVYVVECPEHVAYVLSWTTPRKPERMRAKVRMPIPIRYRWPRKDAFAIESRRRDENVVRITPTVTISTESI